MIQFFNSTIGLASNLTTTTGGGGVEPSPFEYLSGLGDSNMEEVNVTTRWLTGAATDLGVTEINGGISGSLLVNNTLFVPPSAISRWRDYIHANGKYVIAIGTNDLNNGIPIENFEANFNSLVSQLLFYYLPTDIILCNVPFTELADYPSWSQENHDAYNAAILAAATTYGTQFCDFYTATFEHTEYYIPDNLHFNQTGHTALKNTFIASL